MAIAFIDACFSLLYRYICNFDERVFERAAKSAYMPDVARNTLSVNRANFESSLLTIEYPYDALMSPATMTKSSPPIAQTVPALKTYGLNSPFLASLLAV